jgi:hypothetical protein
MLSVRFPLNDFRCDSVEQKFLLSADDETRMNVQCVVDVT